MKIIEIVSNNNGAHRNQTFSKNIKNIPGGWAVIPDDMVTENFPFGEVTTEEIDGVMTVTCWKPLPIPETEEVEAPISEIEQIRADLDYIAIMTGVEL